MHVAHGDSNGRPRSLSPLAGPHSGALGQWRLSDKSMFCAQVVDARQDLG